MPIYIGQNKIHITGIKKVFTKDFDIYTKSNGHNLPPEYQEVKFLESTGTQYIDLGFKFNSKLMPTIKFDNSTYTIPASLTCVTGEFDNNYLTLLRVGNSDETEIYLLGNSTSTYAHYIPGFWTSSEARIEFILYYTMSYRMDFYIGETLLRSLYRSIYSNQTTQENMYLFAQNTVGTGPTRFFVGRIEEYYVRRVKDGYNYYTTPESAEDFMQLIPCYRKSDFKPGMYDIVNNVFKVNAASGPDFILGPNI